jgi:hypothetical protein
LYPYRDFFLRLATIEPSRAAECLMDISANESHLFWGTGPSIETMESLVNLTALEAQNRRNLGGFRREIGEK